MRVEHAIFTSLMRSGRAGYHVVARSPGTTEADLRALATWSPAHGALVVDAANRSSVNFHPLGGDRQALSRTCQGPAEYSGRGGRQLYTHALILDRDQLALTDHQPLALFREALAHGHLLHQADPPEVLAPLELSATYPRRSAPDPTDSIGPINVQDLRDRLARDEAITLSHLGDRIALMDSLLGLLPPSLVATISFTTSLRPSPIRPFRLTLKG